jgi:hypothetical protein
LAGGAPGLVSTTIAFLLVMLRNATYWRWLSHV